MNVQKKNIASAKEMIFFVQAIFFSGSQYMDLITILGLRTLIKQLMTSNAPLMTTNDFNSKCDPFITNMAMENNF